MPDLPTMRSPIGCTLRLVELSKLLNSVMLVLHKLVGEVLSTVVQQVVQVVTALNPKRVKSSDLRISLSNSLACVSCDQKVVDISRHLDALHRFLQMDVLNPVLVPSLLQLSVDCLSVMKELIRPVVGYVRER